MFCNFFSRSKAWNYITWLSGPSVELQAYDLDPENDWQVDLKHMESLINGKTFSFYIFPEFNFEILDRTRAILINSPGNPCGNVFNKAHILEIIALAERHKLPIIADEVYEFLVFGETEFHSFASLSKNVPILTCSGLTKRFLVPNIRLGWIIICDRDGKLSEIRQGLNNIAGRNFGPNSTVQLALPRILKCVPQSFFKETADKIGVRKSCTKSVHRKILFNRNMLQSFTTR